VQGPLPASQSLLSTAKPKHLFLDEPPPPQPGSAAPTPPGLVVDPLLVGEQQRKLTSTHAGFLGFCFACALLVLNVCRPSSVFLSVCSLDQQSARTTPDLCRAYPTAARLAACPGASFTTTSQHCEGRGRQCSSRASPSEVAYTGYNEAGKPRYFQETEGSAPGVWGLLSKTHLTMHSQSC
jgi:hypothetical protein